jgi:Holliday junction resolvase RusA-like endonuclease
MSTGIEEVVAFTVPYLIPPTVNHAYQPCMYTGRDGYAHRGRKVSPEVKAFKDAVAIFARGRTVAPQDAADRRKVRYTVRMDVYLGPRQRGDFDNFWKCGLDALVNCGVIHSDAFVDGENSKCVVHKDDRENPRTEYLVTRLEH